MGSRYGLQIRTATPADAQGIAELMASAGFEVGVSSLTARLEALSRGTGIALVALEWGPPSGIIVVNWMQTLGADHPVALVSMLLVGPEERRRGIGRLLLKAGAQAARSAGCGDMELLQRSGDAGLSAFAVASGFVEAGSMWTRPLRKRG